jgi:methionine-rich copper-binding protein CopC
MFKKELTRVKIHRSIRRTKQVSTRIMVITMITLMLIGVTMPSAIACHPPEVASTSPGNDAANTPVSTTIKVVFNQDIDDSGVSVVVKSGSAIAGSLTYGDDSVTFAPDSPLKFDSRYTVTVSGAVGADGYEMTPYTWSFKTVKQVKLLVTSESPAKNTDVYLRGLTSIKVAFNKEIDQTFDSANRQIKVLDNNGNLVPYTWAPGQVLYTSTSIECPYYALTAGKTYTVVVSGVKDLAGNLMEPYAWSFNTKDVLKVVEITPADGATKVSLTGPVKVTFDREIVPSYSNVPTVVDQAGNAIAMVTVAIGANYMTWAPVSQFKANSAYTITLENVAASDGSGIMKPFTARFTTAAAPTLTPSPLPTLAPLPTPTPTPTQTPTPTPTPVVTFDLSLDQGWNIISLPIMPDDNDIADLFSAEQLANIDVIWSYDDGEWIYWTTAQGYTSQFSALSTGKGYAVYCNAPMTVRITGTAATGPIPMSQLSQGWNLIGYPSTTSIAVSSIYRAADVVWKMEDNEWLFWTTEPGYTNQFDTLSPGLGYWIYKA